MTLLQSFAEYAVAEREARLSPELRHHAKRALVDWFAALLPGAAHPQTHQLANALSDELGHGHAYVYGIARRAPIRTAALINATASHIVEFDDIFRDAMYHPGCPTIGAALAAAQARQATPDVLLRAIIVGYEVSTRIGIAVQPSHYKYWHTTGTIGTFGAAAAVATVLGLDRDRTVHALATAGTMAAGLQQAFRSDSMSKPLHAGHAAEAGALAALGAREGMTGAVDILDGAVGFGAAMSTNADWSRATAGLGSRYNIAQMTFKNHGCCGHSFAAIDAALELRRLHRIEPNRIARIRIGTYKTALDVTGGIRRATTPFEGRFSMAYAVATALVHGSVRLDAFSPARLADPLTAELANLVEIHIEPTCEQAFPTKRSATVVVELRDGTQVGHFQPTRKGDPDAPLDDEDLTAKLLELGAPVIGIQAARRLAEQLWSLDEGHVQFAIDSLPDGTRSSAQTGAQARPPAINERRIRK